MTDAERIADIEIRLEHDSCLLSVPNARWMLSTIRAQAAQIEALTAELATAKSLLARAEPLLGKLDAAEAQVQALQEEWENAVGREIKALRERQEVIRQRDHLAAQVKAIQQALHELEQECRGEVDRLRRDGAYQVAQWCADRVAVLTVRLRAVAGVPAQEPTA